MTKSPITAPSPAMNPISIGDKVSAKMRSIIAPVATVKVDTNKIPAKNAPTYPRFPRCSK